MRRPQNRQNQVIRWDFADRVSAAHNMALEQLQTLQCSSDLNKKSTLRCRLAAETAIRCSRPAKYDTAERISRSTLFPRAARPAAGLRHRAAVGGPAGKAPRGSGGEGLAAGR